MAICSREHTLARFAVTRPIRLQRTSSGTVDRNTNRERESARNHRVRLLRARKIFGNVWTKDVGDPQISFRIERAEGRRIDAVFNGF